MKTKIFHRFLLLTTLLITVCSCKDDNEAPSPETSFSITIEGEDTRPVVPQTGGTITIPFTATGNWTASLMNDRADSWITLTPSSGSAGDVLLSITTTANDTYDERNATVVLRCGDDSENIVVTQKQKDALLVSSSKYEVEAKGGEISVEVQANISFEVEIKSDWIRQVDASSTRALTTSVLNFTIDANDTGEKREGEIIIKSEELSETVTVYQGYEDFITLTQKEFSLPEEGGSVDIEIRSTVNYEAKILDDVDWITEIETRAVSTHTRHYNVIPNDSYDPREAKIVFYSLEDETLADTVSIYQMYKGAILVAKNEYQFDIQGGDLNFIVSSNLEFDVIVSDEWIQQTETRSLFETELHFIITENTEGKEREGTITVKDKNSTKQQIVTIKQSYTDLTREALIALYKATDGDNWTNNENWCSDKPITEWYGIYIRRQNELNIALGFNNLRGHIPNEICNLTNLNTLDLQGNVISGKIPEDIGNLKQIKILCLAYNHLSGNIPGSIGELDKLEILELQENELSGELPFSICELESLTEFQAQLNKIEGSIPNNIVNLKKLQSLRLSSNNLSGEIPASIGNMINLKDLVLGDNRLSGNIPNSIWNLEGIKTISLENNSFTGELPQECIKLKKLESLELCRNNLSGSIPKWLADLPFLSRCRLFDNYFAGTIPNEVSKCPNWKLWRAEYNIIPQKNNYKLAVDYYTSTDFSKDGEVVILQQHTKGNGINLVLVGELFLDKDMDEHGLYDTKMREAMEIFFSIEPTKSLRDLFDVSYVRAISKNDYLGGETSFMIDRQGGKYLLNDFKKLNKYIQKAVGKDIVKNVTTILVINEYSESSICNITKENGGVNTIAFCPYKYEGEYFKINSGFLKHEAIGHGFGILFDEYVLLEGIIPVDEKNSLLNELENGMSGNIDFTNDPQKVRWAHFITDPRYALEKIGIYEGAYWSKGIYKSVSGYYSGIMDDCGGRFNAPSREAIYKRAMKLAYGDSWTYDYEEFVKFDAPTLEEINKEAESRSIPH